MVQLDNNGSFQNESITQKDSPIRVGQILGKYVGGGVESVVMNYYRNINKDKIQFDFICDEDSTDIPYNEIEEMGGRVILIPSYQNIFKYKKELTRIFKKNNYKIIHSHINTLSILPLKVAKKTGIPVRIAHSHSTTNKKEIKKNLLKQLLKPFSKTYATHYFCCSEQAGRWLFGNKAYNEGKVFLLHNAIDLEKFKYNKKIRAEKRKELGLKDNQIVIGHLGRFVAQKNHTFLIDIFNEFQKKQKNSVLLLAGQGPLQEKIKNKVDRLGLKPKVKFLGQINDADRIYQAIDILIFPSLYEGLSVTNIEAQAAGLLCELSNNISEEAKILGSTRFISLKTSAIEWATIIVEDYVDFDRQNMLIKNNMDSFNIKKEAIKLEEKYTALAMGIKND